MSAQIKVDDLFFVRDRTLRRQPPSSLVAGAPVSQLASPAAGGQVTNGRTFKNLFTFSHTGDLLWGTHFKLAVSKI